VTDYAQAAPILHSEGWGVPVPCAPGCKKPLLVGWSRYCDQPAQDIQVELWTNKWPDANVALALSTRNDLFCVDQDIDDATDAARATAVANDTLGYSPFTRIGRSPRWLRLYRCAGANPEISPGD
jgi:hypothetical protein